MNIINIGVDIVSKKRLINSNVENKFLNEMERKILNDINDKDGRNNFISGRWAAKEAIIKIFDKKISFSKISILNCPSGKPQVYINDIFDKNIMLSISHEKEYTVAFAILIGL